MIYMYSHCAIRMILIYSVSVLLVVLCSSEDSYDGAHGKYLYIIYTFVIYGVSIQIILVAKIFQQMIKQSV
jgi:hypothetical protein